jgi:hypothetical protein
MSTSQNNDPRWILATIVESGNHPFWGWHELIYVMFFCVRGNNFFFAFAWENSPVQPLLVASHQVAVEMGFCCGELLGNGRYYFSDY